MNDYWLAHNGPDNNNWDGATYYTGELAAFDATKNVAYLSDALAWANGFNFDLIGGDTTHVANSQAAGEAYIRLSQIQNDPTLRGHITASIHSMVTSSGNNDWAFVDTLNMSMPSFAQLGAINGDPAYFDKMFAEFNRTKRSLYDTSVHLWWRDANFTGSTVHWSRGNGWAFAALAKALAVVPITDPHDGTYVRTFREMASALRSLQRADGFWNPDLDNPGDHGGPETSGTAFFTFGMAWGINAGVLDRATYLPVVKRAWRGLTTVAVASSGFLGYVQPIGSAPADAPADSTTNFGVGAFLLAGREVTKLGL